MGKAIKRRMVKISLAILVVVGILLGLHAGAARDWGPKMSFGFLDGRTMTGRIDRARDSRRITREVYSFEADFNDVCAKMDSELSELGFSKLRGGNEGVRHRDYLRKKSSSIRWLSIRIIDKHKFSMYSTPKSSEYSSPDRYEYHYEEGWVSVEIQRWRRQFWPPQRLLDHLK